MGGFKLKERTAILRFDGTQYDGAEVVMRLQMPLRTYRQLAEWKAASEFEAVIELFCGFVKSWNLEDDQGSIPHTPDGFNRINDLGFLHALLDGWEAAIKGVTEVAAPLESSSNSGSTSGSETPSVSPPE